MCHYARVTVTTDLADTKTEETPLCPVMAHLPLINEYKLQLDANQLTPSLFHLCPATDSSTVGYENAITYTDLHRPPAHPS